MLSRMSLGAAAALCLAACGDGGQAEPSGPVADNGALATGANALSGQPERAGATLRTADGTVAGTATVAAVPDGLQIVVEAQAMPSGEHGIHVHMVGRCDPPQFESAGGHWNPAERRHGLENPLGPHAGDMPNLEIGSDGRGRVEHVLPGDMAALFDADGSAIVLHADVDDQRSDPSGNSGGRLACGVLEPR